MPYAYRQGANIRVTFLVERLRGTTRLVVDYVVQVLSLVYCSALVVATFLQARHIMRTGTTFTTIDAPLWPGHLVVSLALFVAAVMMLVDLGEVRKGRSSLFKDG
jgi:TRAP-type C4-dicarboxylate transport system permease small subunit